MLPRRDKQTNKQGKIGLLSFWSVRSLVLPWKFNIVMMSYPSQLPRSSQPRPPLKNWRCNQVQGCLVEGRALQAPHKGPWTLDIITKRYEGCWMLILLINAILRRKIWRWLSWKDDDDLVPSLWQLPRLFDKSWQALSTPPPPAWPFLSAISKHEPWNVGTSSRLIIDKGRSRKKPFSIRTRAQMLCFFLKV